MAAYEDAMKNTSSKKAPWHIIPADRKWFAHLLASEIIVKTLEDLNLAYPVLAPAALEKLEESRQLLLKEK